MLERLFSLFRLLWDAGAKTDKNTKDIGALQEQNQESTQSIRVLIVERERDREAAELRERASQDHIASLEKEIQSLRRELHVAQENTELRVRLALSEFLRQLPPPDKPE